MLKSNNYNNSLMNWENAGKLLANALSTYLSSCTSLEISAPERDWGLVLRIESSLHCLHIQLSRELGQSRAILARMRNRARSRFRSLPNEIMAAIFMDVVYAPAPDDMCHPPMRRALNIIIKRLTTLLSVCTSWRNLGMNLTGLWTFIPLGGTWQKFPSSATTSFFLERSQASLPQDRPLRLVALPYQMDCLYVPLTNRRLPRFTSVNIECNYVRGIGRLIEKFLQQGSLSSWSELSIHHEAHIRNQAQPRLPLPSEFLRLRKNHDLFLNLISSLSILRIKGANILWHEVTFSSQLVELHLQSVVLGFNSELTRVLQMLQSASELRILKFIFVVAFPNESESRDIPSTKFSFPKLQSLLLEDLNFNVLEILLHSIVPGSHHLTLFLTTRSQILCDVDDFEEMPMQLVYRLLHGIGVDTLLLEGSHKEQAWLDADELQQILRSLPTLKTLRMAHWRFETHDLLALEHPRSEGTGSGPHLTPFPSLNKLSLIDCEIMDPEILPRVISSHPLQSLELDGWRPDDSDSESDATGSEPAFEFDIDPGVVHFKKNDPVIRRVKSIVPHFRLGSKGLDMEDFNHHVWQLW